MGSQDGKSASKKTNNKKLSDLEQKTKSKKTEQTNRSDEPSDAEVSVQKDDDEK